MLRALAVLFLISGLAWPFSAGAELGIDVEELPEDRWRVTYRGLKSHAGLRFARPTFHPRSEAWRLDSPAECSLAGTAGSERLECAGELPPSLSFELPTDTRIEGKGYPLHVAFGDGGRLFYSGHLALAGGGPASLCYRAAEGRQVALRGERGREVCWQASEEEAAEGLYVFFGETEPEASDALTLIADRGLPVWLRDRVTATLPRLFDHFRGRLGLDLPWVPTVLLSWSDEPTSGRTFAGGTLEGQLQVHLHGLGWKESDGDALEGLLFHLAHEAAHLWNGQLTRLRFDPREEWLKEGGADFLGGQALADLGLLAPDRWRRRQEAAEGECEELLAGRPLASPLDGRGADYRVLYACGLHFSALLDREAREAAEPADFTSLTRAVLGAAVEAGGAYESRAYFDALAAVAGPPSGRAAYRLLTVGFDDGS